MGDTIAAILASKTSSLKPSRMAEQLETAEEEFTALTREISRRISELGTGSRDFGVQCEDLEHLLEDANHHVRDKGMRWGLGTAELLELGCSWELAGRPAHG